MAHRAESGSFFNFGVGAGGRGAEIGGNFSLTAGEVLQIAVGGAGGDDIGGGGGGSFVVAPGNAPLVIAGGGGGGGVGIGGPVPGQGGLIGPNGGGSGVGAGGIGGNGGDGGFFTAGGNGSGTGGAAFPDLAGGSFGGGFGGGGGGSGGGYGGGGGGGRGLEGVNPGGRCRGLCGRVWSYRTNVIRGQPLSSGADSRPLVKDLI